MKKSLIPWFIICLISSSSSDAKNLLKRASGKNGIGEMSKSLSIHARFVNSLALEQHLLNPNFHVDPVIAELLNLDNKTYDGLVNMKPESISFEGLQGAFSLLGTDLNSVSDGLTHLESLRQGFKGIGEPSKDLNDVQLALETFSKERLTEFNERKMVDLKDALEKMKNEKTDWTDPTRKSDVALILRPVYDSVTGVLGTIDKFKSTPGVLQKFDKLLAITATYGQIQKRFDLYRKLDRKLLDSMEKNMGLTTDIANMLDSSNFEYLKLTEAVITPLPIQRIFTDAFRSGHSDLGLLKSDLTGPLLHKTLGNMTKVLEGLQPILAFSSDISAFSRNLSRVFKDPKEMDDLGKVQSYIQTALATGGKSKYLVDADKVKKLISPSKSTIQFGSEASDFESYYKNLVTLEADFSSLKASMDSLLKTEEFNLVALIGQWQTEVLKAINGLDVTAFRRLKGEKRLRDYIAAVDVLKVKFKEIGDAIGKLQPIAKTLFDNRGFVEAVETWMSSSNFFSHLELSYQSIINLRTGTQLAKDIRGGDSGIYQTSKQLISNLITTFTSGLRIVKDGVDKLRKAGSLITWQTDQELIMSLASGAHLFRSFDIVHNQKTLVEELMVDGVKLEGEVNGMKDQTVKSEVQKIWNNLNGQLASVNFLITDMIRLDQEVGDGTTLEQILEALQKAASIRNPEVNLDQWREAMDLLKTSGLPGLQKVQKGLDGLRGLDLDFASSQKNLNGQLEKKLEDLRVFLDDLNNPKVSTTSTPEPITTPFPDYSQFYYYGLGFGIPIFLILTFLVIRYFRQGSEYSDKRPAIDKYQMLKMGQWVKDVPVVKKRKPLVLPKGAIEPYTKSDKEKMFWEAYRELENREKEETVEVENQPEVEDLVKPCLDWGLLEDGDEQGQWSPHINRPATGYRLIAATINYHDKAEWIDGFCEKEEEILRIWPQREEAIEGDYDDWTYGIMEKLSQRITKQIPERKSGDNYEAIREAANHAVATAKLACPEPNQFIDIRGKLKAYQNPNLGKFDFNKRRFACCHYEDREELNGIIVKAIEAGVDAIIEVCPMFKNSLLNPKDFPAGVVLPFPVELVEKVQTFGISVTLDSKGRCAAYHRIEGFPVGLAPLLFEPFIGLYELVRRKKKVVVIDRYGSANPFFFPLVDIFIHHLYHDNMHLLHYAYSMYNRRAVDLVTSIGVQFVQVAAYFICLAKIPRVYWDKQFKVFEMRLYNGYLVWWEDSVITWQKFHHWDWQQLGRPKSYWWRTTKPFIKDCKRRIGKLHGKHRRTSVLWEVEYSGPKDRHEAEMDQGQMVMRQKVDGYIVMARKELEFLEKVKMGKEARPEPMKPWKARKKKGEESAKTAKSRTVTESQKTLVKTQESVMKTVKTAEEKV